MFLLEYACGKRLDSIVIEHGHGSLIDDWTTIKRFVNEVDRAATHFHTMLERLPLRIKPGERRQKTRMNIQYPPPERLDKARRQQPHVTGKTNKIHAIIFQDPNDLPLVLFTIAAFPFNYPRFQSAFIRG